MKALLLQNSPVEGFGAYLEAVEDGGVDATVIRVDLGEPVPSIDPDFIVVGGTPVSALAFDGHARFAQEQELLREQVARGTPVFGVCCGGQVLARLLGGSVSRLPAMEIGCVELVRAASGARDPLLRGFPARFLGFQWHADAFHPPVDAHVLVTGGASPAQMFRRGPNVGILFHLEYTADEIEDWFRCYAHELAGTDADPEHLAHACAARADEMRALGRTLMRNFIDSVRRRTSRGDGA